MSISEATDRRIPVTVIGGFLGAGKTTLVNHVLRSTDRQIGVIVNEFGKTGIDGRLIETLADDVEELTAGCLCCSGREDLLRALVKLACRGEQAGAVPGHILIELSGVADPVPVLHTLLDPDLRPLLRLDGLVTVVDTRNLATTLAEHPEATLQLAYATTVVLNKVDLVTSQQLELAADLIRGLQPLSRIVEAHSGQVDVEQLLGEHGFGADWRPPVAQTRHTPGLKSFTLEGSRPLTPESWFEFVQGVVGRPGQVLRVKGFISLQEYPYRLLFHAVRDVISVEATQEPADGRSQLVVIGRGLVPEEERAAFRKLLGPDGTPSADPRTSGDPTDRRR